MLRAEAATCAQVITSGSMTAVEEPALLYEAISDDYWCDRAPCMLKSTLLTRRKTGPQAVVPSSPNVFLCLRALKMSQRC